MGFEARTVQPVLQHFVDCEIILKWIKSMASICGLYGSASFEGPPVGSCELGKKLPGFIKGVGGFSPNGLL